MKKILSLLLCLSLVFSLAACGGTPAETTAPPTTTAPTEPAPDPAELYAAATAQVDAMDSMTLMVTTQQEMTVGPDTFLESSDYSLSLEDRNSDALIASLTGTTSWGEDYYVEQSEIFSGGTLYASLDTYAYSVSMTAADYLSRYIPAVLLDPALYGTITLQDDTTILFSDATALESWLDQEYAELAEASGTVILDTDGSLKESSYTVTYTLGNVRFDLTVNSTIVPTGAQVTVPTDTQEYVALDNADIPLMLERSYGYLLQAESVSSILAETLVTQAAGALRTQQTEMSFYGSGSDQLAEINYDVQVVDYGLNETTEYTQTERFENGVYTFSADGSEPEAQSGITASDIAAYRQSSTAECLPWLTDTETMTATDLGGSYLLEYTFTEDHGTALSQNVCYTLFQDATLLDGLATAYRTETAEGYLAIDKYTGLPTAVSTTYSGFHTIEGAEYQLALESTQTIYAASLSAYEEITDEQLPAETSAQPTPLFYHVTGSNGEQMWLLGTIHVGDGRTANLPSQIYDAFSASDALAVEFDSDSFMDQLEDDPELAASVAQCYYYTDGSTTQDHIEDTELYDSALKLLKASGNYSSTAALLKPSIWSQSIENFYLQQGYGLTSDYGVDFLLMKLAEESGKEVLDVESGLEQIQMLTGFSDTLQEWLLYSAVSTDAMAYNQDVRELYELWCSGDEAALIAYLTADPSEYTEEELALYEEYNKAMSSDRNAGMLEIAKGYLTSGETVFYAVGLAHLLAEDGLVNALRSAGYTVELVSYE